VPLREQDTTLATTWAVKELGNEGKPWQVQALMIANQNLPLLSALPRLKDDQKADDYRTNSCSNISDRPYRMGTEPLGCWAAPGAMLGRAWKATGRAMQDNTKMTPAPCAAGEQVEVRLPYRPRAYPQTYIRQPRPPHRRAPVAKQGGNLVSPQPFRNEGLPIWPTIQTTRQEAVCLGKQEAICLGTAIPGM
jgi:hypothetical protein